MSRSDIVIALGGGVTGDLAGFAAATYQRGIGCIQMPTTLLATVDSSVGGKTALDLGSGKNQIGVFCQPVRVICDTDTLTTLPVDEYRNGCAEVIKYAMLGSIDLYNDIRRIPIAEQYESVISACVDMKRDIVEKDEYDRGTRMLLNFGHTFGHAIEACSNYTVPHGKAVAAGMAVITKAAAVSGICDISVYDDLISLLEQYGLPTDTGYPAERMAQTVMSDKKRQGDRITVIMPEKTGRCLLHEISKDEIISLLRAGGLN